MEKSTKKEGIYVKTPEIKEVLKFPELESFDTAKYSHFQFWSSEGQELEFLNYLKSIYSVNPKLYHTFVRGETIEGKGVFLENLAEYYIEKSDKIVLLDLTGVNYEGAFWCKKYPCYFVYPQLLKSSKKNTNSNVIEISLSIKNTWDKIIKRAFKYKRIVVLLCQNVMDSSVLKALLKLFKVLLNDESLIHIHKILLLREISFIGYKHGILKLIENPIVKELKRLFISEIKTGRHSNNQIFCDSQGLDIDSMIQDNLALMVYKRCISNIENLPKPVQNCIQTLKKHQAIFEFRGKFFTGIIKYNDWHKTEVDKIQDLGVFPEKTEKKDYNKIVENRYINVVSEFYSNILGRLIINRRRQLKNPDNSRLSIFELADLLSLEGQKIITRNRISIKNPRLVYSEIKFRSSDSSSKKIEIKDVKKLISDLPVKKIYWDFQKNKYLWDLDQELLQKLNLLSLLPNQLIPVIIEMVSPNGATKGSQTLMQKHHIYNRIVKINEKNFYI